MKPRFTEKCDLHQGLDRTMVCFLDGEDDLATLRIPTRHVGALERHDSWLVRPDFCQFQTPRVQESRHVVVRRVKKTGIDPILGSLRPVTAKTLVNIGEDSG
ncbi:hypothetical protein N7467_007820 [Penicillium canescens]|nr:hypothetical protein N7467_007820 [Penicillium canescens]